MLLKNGEAAPFTILPNLDRFKVRLQLRDIRAMMLKSTVKAAFTAAREARVCAVDLRGRS